jgi:ABC-type lipoprotein release transport system permease subunit
MFFTYSLRNLFQRLGTTLPTVIAIAATVGGTTVMLSMMEGLLHSIESSSHPSNVLVLTHGARRETASILSAQVLSQIEVVPGVAVTGGVKQMSPEFLYTLNCRDASARLNGLRLRAVDASALQVHQGVTIERGDFPGRSQPGIVVGRRLINTCQGLTEHGALKVGRTEWPITGVLNGADMVFDSELWCDRTALMNMLQRHDVNVVYATLEVPSRANEYAAALKSIPGAKIEAVSERDFFERSFEMLPLYKKTIGIVALILALASIFACSSIMYTAALSRQRELATLLAIGYMRWRIGLLMVQECMFLTLTSGAVGILLGFAFNGRSFNYKQMSLAYRALLSPRVALVALAISIVIGFIGSIVSMIQVARMQVLTALRDV